MKSLLELNRRFLHQALCLLGEMDSVTYASPCTEVFSSSIGQHIRHCVEHYEEFLAALREERELDYDKRPRDLRVETDISEAITRLRKIRKAVGSLSGYCQPLRIRDCEVDLASESSVCREMQFLVSHTVHHFALISVIAGLNGIRTPEDFGIAPSTLKARQTT